MFIRKEINLSLQFLQGVYVILDVEFNYDWSFGWCGSVKRLCGYDPISENGLCHIFPPRKQNPMQSIGSEEAGWLLFIERLRVRCTCPIQSQTAINSLWWNGWFSRAGCRFGNWASLIIRWLTGFKSARDPWTGPSNSGRP